MPRDLPLGNGTLLVNFDASYQLRDLYWPHIGQENHTAGHPFRFGVWVDGRFAWLADPGWERELAYAPDTLVTAVRLRHAGLGVSLACQDAVDFHESLYLRQLEVRDDSAPAAAAGHGREVRLFFAQDFRIGGQEVGNSAYYEPERRALLHYLGQHWFLINAARLDGDEWRCGLDQWAVGLKEVQGKEGTWRDAEDGQLSGNAVAQGSIDSVAAVHLTVPRGGRAVAWYWIAAGRDFAEVVTINRSVRQKTPPSFLERTRAYWALWVNKEHRDCTAVPAALARLYRRSLLVVRSHIDNGGAVIAATDFDITHFAKDTYGYLWPRDGALAANALSGAGYSEVSRLFFEFCHRVITPEGYLLHKYNADGSLASSWHGWYQDGRKVLPVQEDETALVLWALWRHFRAFHDVEFVKPLFRGLIVRAANWLAAYRDPATGLPQPSWDLWEERLGVHAWTVAAVWAGLQAAANFAEAFGELALAQGYRQAATEMAVGARQYLWQPQLGRYARSLVRAGDAGWTADPALDASMIGLWYFGMLPAGDPGIQATMAAIADRLWVKTPVGGLARYEDDYYHQVSRDVARIPGNPWFLCTLWLAQWQVASATQAADLDRALVLLEWVAARALPSGVMAEQVHPETGAPLSVSPLTWSHAAFVTAVQEYAERQAQLRGGPAEETA